MRAPAVKRFASFPMNKAYLYLAARYVELNPVILLAIIISLLWGN